MALAVNPNKGGNISMRKSLILAALIAAASASPALAGGDHTCQGGHNCNGGSSTPTSTTNITNSPSNTNTAMGGKAEAISAAAADAKAGAVAVTGPQSQSYAGSQSNAQSATQQYEGYQGYTGQQNLSIKTDVPRQAPPAIAPNMAIGSLSCKSSAVIGLSSPFGGISGGIPMTDEVCERSVLSIRLQELGLHGAAIELLMQDERVERAVRAAQGRGRTSFVPAPVTVNPVPTAVQGN